MPITGPSRLELKCLDPQVAPKERITLWLLESIVTLSSLRPGAHDLLVSRQLRFNAGRPDCQSLAMAAVRISPTAS